MTGSLAKLKDAKRIGLVLGGGAMRCAFQIGVIECMRELSIRPALCIGISGGAWNAAAVAAGTDKRLRHYWRAFSRMPYMSATNLLRERSPFIYGTLHRRTFSRYVGKHRLHSDDALPCLVGISRLRDRRLRFVDLREVDDPLHILLATNYVPFFYTHAPRIDGERYGDGGLANNCPYEEAFARGCDVVILVIVKGESEGGLYRSPRETDHQIPPELLDRVVVIRPRHRLPFSWTERRWRPLSELINLGYLRAREVFLGEEHRGTDIKAPGISPTMRLAQLWKRLSSRPWPGDIAAE